MPTYHRGQAPLIGFWGEKVAKKLAAIAVVVAGYGGDMDEELVNTLLDDMDYDRYGKVKCPKIEGMLPKLMKMVEGEIVAMVSQHTRTISPAEKRREWL